MLVVDPINLRYATGARNMQVWTMHNIVRYALVAEVDAFRASLTTCEQSVCSLYEFAVPGVRESEAFGHLVGQSLTRGGEYPETRLLACGPRTKSVVPGELRSRHAGG